MNNPVVKILSLFMSITGMFIIALMGRLLLGKLGFWYQMHGLDDLIAVNICIFLGLAVLTLVFMWVGRQWSAPPASQSSRQEEEAVRELSKMQSRLEERITNLETILLNRVHDSVRPDQF